MGDRYASTVVSAIGARSARNSELIINQTNIASDASISLNHAHLVVAAAVAGAQLAHNLATSSLEGPIIFNSN